MAKPRKNWGLVARFENPATLLHAAQKVQDAGYTRWETWSPFPIHGMDRAMGLPVSKLGFLVFGGGLTGGLLGAFLQWWTSAGPHYSWWPDWLVQFQGYAINISNKPLFAWESSIPIIFELTVLLSALTAVGGMLALNGLPKPYNPLFNSENFSRSTDDAFFVHVSGRDRGFTRAKTAGDLFGLGALGVEFVDHDGATAVGETGNALAGAVPATAGTPAPVAPQHTTGDL